MHSPSHLSTKLSPVLRVNYTLLHLLFCVPPPQPYPVATAQGNALQELCTVSEDKMLLPQCGELRGALRHTLESHTGVCQAGLRHPYPYMRPGLYGLLFGQPCPETSRIKVSPQDNRPFPHLFPRVLDLDGWLVVIVGFRSVSSFLFVSVTFTLLKCKRLTCCFYQ